MGDPTAGVSVPVVAHPPHSWDSTFTLVLFFSIITVVLIQNLLEGAQANFHVHSLFGVFFLVKYLCMSSVFFYWMLGSSLLFRSFKIYILKYIF